MRFKYELFIFTTPVIIALFAGGETMTKRLLLRLHHKAPNTADWLIIDRSNHITTEPKTNTLADLATIDADWVEVFIDSSWVRLIELSLPSNHKKTLEKALPFELQQHLATNIEKTHVQLMSYQQGKQYVAVIDKKRLTALQNQLAELGKPIHCILPEVLAIKIDAQRVIQIEQNALIRLAEYYGQTIDAKHSEELLKLPTVKMTGDEFLRQAVDHQATNASILACASSHKATLNTNWRRLANAAAASALLAFMLNQAAPLIVSQHHLTKLKQKTLATYQRVLPKVKSLAEAKTKAAQFNQQKEPLLDELIAIADTKPAALKITRLDYSPAQLQITLANTNSAQLVAQFKQRLASRLNTTALVWRSEESQ